MSQHRFILQPGIWQGDGKISFSMAEDEFDFHMQWTVLPSEEGKIFFKQTIDIPALSQEMKNQFALSQIGGDRFQIELDNQVIGKVMGKGVIDQTCIAWEFREPEQAFEGYEVYMLEGEDLYKMRGEFTGGDGLRTYVTGQIQRHQ